jgi:25S rRNA (uracil2843-N3)-methyltransferase
MGQYDRKAQSARKHGPILSSSTSKAPTKPPPVSKPEWRGSGYTRKAKPKPHLDGPKPIPLAQHQPLPVELQQLILNIFKDGFGEKLMDFEELKELLREVNEKVLEREWVGALETEERREAYAVRWSPSRALACANVLAELCEQGVEEGWSVLPSSGSETPSTTKCVCFGGNAAEVMAFGALLRYLKPHAAGTSQGELDGKTESSTPVLSRPLLDMTIIDSADWKSVLNKLLTATTTPPPLSKYASASARASNHALLSPSSVALNFQQQDIFAMTGKQLIDIIGPNPCLATFFLTLGNLYNHSIPRTTAFMFKLDAVLPVGSIILIVDVIGSSVPSPSAATADPESEEAKPYTLSWLLDRVLLGKPVEKVPTQGRGKKVVEEEEANKPLVKWERVVAEDMKINKLDEKLRYPGSLENVKFQILAYRRV